MSNPTWPSNKLDDHPMRIEPHPAGHPLPHEGVYVRLAVPEVHGIGVFAIRPIPMGTNIFANDQADMVWIDANLVEELPEPVRKLYLDFGVAQDARLGVPRNFNLLTTGWYLNEAPAGALPNVVVDARLNFIATREIAEGEELLTDYSDYSQPPEHRELVGRTQTAGEDPIPQRTRR